MHASRVGLLLILATGYSARAEAAIRVHPTGVNVNGQGATTAFLTFGPLDGYIAAEAFWCGDLLTEGGQAGAKCDPATIYGLLPSRYDRSTRSAGGAYTDIMSIPSSVARRAYLAAAAGKSGQFFYVRRFIHPAGGQDQYVAVTCRLTAGGARVPLSLTDVRLSFEIETPVLQVKAGGYISPFVAVIRYTGTGPLKGRWEIVLPGQEQPSVEDLLTEATLPPERRGTQRRYAEIERFNVFLPPVGRFTLQGPDPARIPTAVDGQYLILLRIEVSDDKEADSDLTVVGTGPGVVHAGGVAGFPMPVLRYIVGSGGNEQSPVGTVEVAASSSIGSEASPEVTVDLQWTPVPRALYYHIEVRSAGQRIHQGYVRPPSSRYSLPPFVAAKAADGKSQWRVVAIDDAARVVGRSTWVALKLGGSKP